MYPGGWYGQGQISIQGQVMPIYVPPMQSSGNYSILNDILCPPLLISNLNWQWQYSPGLLGCRCEAVSDTGWQTVGHIGGKTTVPGENTWEQILMGYSWAVAPPDFHSLQMQALKDESSGDVYWTWVMPRRYRTIDANTPAPIVFEPWVVRETVNNGVLINGAIPRKMWMDTPSNYDDDGMSGATKFNYAANVAVLSTMVARGLTAPSHYDRLFHITIQHKQGAYRAIIETQAGHTGYDLRGAFWNLWLGYPPDGVKEEKVVGPLQCTEDQWP